MLLKNLFKVILIFVIIGMCWLSYLKGVNDTCTNTKGLVMKEAIGYSCVNYTVRQMNYYYDPFTNSLVKENEVFNLD